MSFDYENSKIQILTADSQPSYKSGVVTLVTGLLTVKDGERMRFSQSFFLVPQKGSYFVLNDVFRYVSDELVAEPEANKKEVEEEVEVIPQVAEAVAIPTQQTTETLVKEPARAVENVDAPKKSFAVIVSPPSLCLLSNSIAQSELI